MNCHCGAPGIGRVSICTPCAYGKRSCCDQKWKRK